MEHRVHWFSRNDMSIGYHMPRIERILQEFNPNNDIEDVNDIIEFFEITKFVDNGADLVIGGHPHVLQPREIYNDVEIVYSLGNFCYGGNRYPENRTIIYQANLDINKTKGTIEFTSNIIPCYVYTGDRNYYQPDIIEDQKEKEKVLNFMEGEKDLPY